MEERKVVSIEELKKQSQPLVDIIGFEPGQFITLRLKRISLLAMCKSGKIPNTLLQKVTELFGGAKNDGKQASESAILSNVDDMESINKIIDVICEESMVEPKFSEVNEFLTDEQKMEIFQWTQGGIKSLESFRAEQGDIGLFNDEQTLQSSTQ